MLTGVCDTFPYHLPVSATCKFLCTYFRKVAPNLREKTLKLVIFADDCLTIFAHITKCEGPKQSETVTLILDDVSVD